MGPGMQLTRRAMLGRGIVAGLLAGAAGTAWAEAPSVSLLPRRRGAGGAPQVVPGSAEPLVAAAKLGGAVGFVVLDAATGTVLEARDPDLALPPASVMKAVTAGFALDRLGPTHRFVTRVLATGPISDGIVQGDLILAGGGDPTLDTDMLGDLAARLAATGLRGVTGRFGLWAGALPALERIDSEQPDFVGYNPAIGGLNLNYNRVHFEWRRAGSDWALSMDARAERFIPPVRLARVRVVQRDLPVFAWEGPEQWSVASAALGKGGARWLPVRHPAAYAGEVFQTLCAAQGIRLPDPVLLDRLPQARELARHDSAALDAILRDMLKHSTNLTAEVTGLAASQAASLAGSARSMQEWARLHHGVPAHIADHSGLGADSRITAASLARLMAGLGQGPLPALLKEHGMRDAEGRVAKGHPVRVQAKTGTLNFVSTLAGYIDPPGGRRLAFAILSGDLARRAALPPEDRERPPGGEAWAKRARGLQGQLLARWAGLYA